MVVCEGGDFLTICDVTSTLTVNHEPDLAQCLQAFCARHHRQFTHAATSTISTRSSGTGSRRSRNTSSCSAIASRTFVSASARFLPYLHSQEGSALQQQRIRLRRDTIAP